MVAMLLGDGCYNMYRRVNKTALFPGLKEEYPTASSTKLLLASLWQHHHTFDCTWRWISQFEKYLHQT